MFREISVWALYQNYWVPWLMLGERLGLASYLEVTPTPEGELSNTPRPPGQSVAGKRHYKEHSSIYSERLSKHDGKAPGRSTKKNTQTHHREARLRH